MKTQQFNMVKWAFLTLLFSVYCSTIQAQQVNQPSGIETAPSLFLGGGLGINDFGFGGSLEVPVANKLSFYGNAGLGGWGYKLGLGISFYPKNLPYRSSISLGYAYATGLKDFETELAVNPNNENRKVVLDLNPMGTVNFIYSYNFRLGTKSKFVLSTGFAIPVTTNNYQLKTSEVSLTANSVQVIDFIQPGGLILGLKFMFGMD